MIKSLVYSDVVLADASISNANVYYEIGVRHASNKVGCVIVQADWTLPAFDIQQMRTIRFPLEDGSICKKEAQNIKVILKDYFEDYATKLSPVYEVIPSIECTYDEAESQDQRLERLYKFESQIEELNKLMAQIRSIRALPNTHSQKKAKGLELLEKIKGLTIKLQNKVQLEVMFLLRDCALWQEVYDFIEEMPLDVKTIPQIKEQKLLAMSELEGNLEAAGHLEELICVHGESSERYGLLGGRFKRLYREALDEGEQSSANLYLNKAISAYTKGMLQDLNDYYPSCNLPQLLKARNQSGDWGKAKSIASVVVTACERAKVLNQDDPYLVPTLLGAAFDTEDADEAQRLVDQIIEDNLPQAILDNTLPDLRQRASMVQQESCKNSLFLLVEQLESLSEKGGNL